MKTLDWKKTAGFLAIFLIVTGTIFAGGYVTLDENTEDGDYIVVPAGGSHPMTGTIHIPEEYENDYEVFSLEIEALDALLEGPTYTTAVHGDTNKLGVGVYQNIVAYGEWEIVVLDENEKPRHIDYDGTSEETVDLIVCSVKNVVKAGTEDGGPIKVALGSAVSVEAIRDPGPQSGEGENPSFPGLTWSLSSKPEGSEEGDDDLSQSGNTADFTPQMEGEYEITAQCGTDPSSGSPLTASITIEVAKFNGKIVPDDDFEGRSYVKLGVGETGCLEVVLGEGTTLEDLTPLTWDITSGTALIIKDIDTNAGTAIFAAGDVYGEVVLTLTDKNNNTATCKVKVVPPSAGRCVRVEGTNVWKEMMNRYSIGIATEFYLLPKDVSFTNTFFREGTCNGKATGWFHDKVGMDGKTHPAWDLDQWRHVGDGNIDTGCKVMGWDRAKGTVNPTPLPYTAGTFIWPIPWLYTTDTDTAGVAEDPNRVWRRGAVVNQKFTVDAQGTATIQKGDSETVSNEHSDPIKDWFD
jgi:hypothetical protein